MPENESIKEPTGASEAKAIRAVNQTDPPQHSNMGRAELLEGTFAADLGQEWTDVNREACKRPAFIAVSCSIALPDESINWGNYGLDCVPV